MQLDRTLEVQTLIDVVFQGDVALYNMRNYDNKVTAIKGIRKMQ